jgi:hypothetical protein
LSDRAVSSCSIGADFFWLRGVNFLPHALHRRMRRHPIVVVFLIPLEIDLDDPQ